jgi:hypothetical protein
LLRIGVRDFYQAVQRSISKTHRAGMPGFCILPASLDEPGLSSELDWNWMRAAHEAQASFRDNPAIRVFSPASCRA